MRLTLTLGFFFSLCTLGRALDVPPVPQATEFSCGAAVMVAALGYYGVYQTESALAQRMGTNETDGTAISAMVKEARAEGLKVRAGGGFSIADLEAHLKKKQIAIVAAQAWAKDPDSVDYRNDWKDGHYMIVTEIDAGTIRFMDPATLWGRASLPLKEFVDERWHDVSDGKRWQRPAILLEGTPKPAPRWPRVE